MHWLWDLDLVSSASVASNSISNWLFSVATAFQLVEQQQLQSELLTQGVGAVTTVVIRQVLLYLTLVSSPMEVLAAAEAKTEFNGRGLELVLSKSKSLPSYAAESAN